MTRCFSLSCQELSIRYSLNQCGVSFILHLNKEVLLKMDWIVLLFKGYHACFDSSGAIFIFTMATDCM